MHPTVPSLPLNALFCQNSPSIKPDYLVDSCLQGLTEGLADVRCWYAAAPTASCLGIRVGRASDMAEIMNKEGTEASHIKRHQPANRSHMLHQIADGDRTFRNW